MFAHSQCSLRERHIPYDSINCCHIVGLLLYNISDAIIIESCVLIKGWSAVNDAVEILVWSVDL